MTNFDTITSLGIICKDIPGDQKVICPKCSQNRRKSTEKSLYLNVEKGVWKCFNPGCEWENGSGIYNKPMRTYNKPDKTADTMTDQVKKYFLDMRGLKPETVDAFGVTAGMTYMPQVNKEVMAIHHNYRRNGELINIKYRDRDKNFKMVAGAELIFYGMDLVKDFSYVIINEGEEDSQSWYQAGKQAVSVPNGAAIGNQRLEYLDNCIDWINKFDKVYINTDNDTPGIALKNELARRIGKDKCYDITLPDGIKDANLCLLSYNEEALRIAFDKAKPFPLESVLRLSDVYDSLLYELETGLTPGVKIDRMPNLSEFHSWRPGQFGVWSGEPGAGKSSIVDNVSIGLSEEHDWRFGIWSAEKPSVPRHIAELYQIYLDKSFYFSNFDTSRINKVDIDTNRQFFDDHFYFIDTDTASLTVDGLLSKGRELVKRYGINCLILDNWATIEHSSGKTSRHDYAGESITKMKRFAGQNDCDVWLVAHPKKPSGQGYTKAPEGYDVSDSAHFFNMADFGMTTSRNKETGQTDLIKWKNRWRELGDKGTCHFTYKVSTGVFFPADPVNTGQSNKHFLGQQIKRDTEKFKDI